MHECIKMKDLGHLPSDLILVGVENVVGGGIVVREKCLEGEYKFSVEREERIVNLISRSVYIYIYI